MPASADLYPAPKRGRIMLKHLFFALCLALLLGPFWSTLESAGVLANLDRVKAEIHQDRCSRSAGADCLAGVCMSACRAAR